MARKAKLFKLPLGWKLEEVTPRMTKPCQSCLDVPKKVRAVQRIDSIPFPTTKTFCTACAVKMLRESVRLFTENIDEFERTLKV